VIALLIAASFASAATPARALRRIQGTGDFNGDGRSDILWQGSRHQPAP
jgi:hypothetical protein